MCRRPKILSPFAVAFALSVSTLHVSAGEEGLDPSLRALELGVPDLDRAVAFYTDVFGFEAEDSGQIETWASLRNGDARLALALTTLPRAADGTARAYPNFSVGDVEKIGQAVIAAGGSVSQPYDSPVGKAVRYLDPFGHPGHLIDHPWDDLAPEATPSLFNVALAVGDIEVAEQFYTALGFQVSTRDYLPRTLVFKPQGSAQLILHASAEAKGAPGLEGGALLIDTDPSRAYAALASVGSVERTSRAAVGYPTLEIRDPSGILLKLSQPPTTGVAAASLSAEQAARAFERLKSLAGDWQAKSNQGWAEPVAFEVVAGGSVVVVSNSFKDAPQNKMFTMFHLDGDRLLATHYCVSGNQPRLIASAVSDDGNQLTFTYLDGTGLPSRDHGHMDQAVFRFLAPDRFTSRWTWYQKGEEQWLEEIEHRRDSRSEMASASP